MSDVRPFLRWAGGKTQLLPELRRRIPSDFARYFEPFAGGAALFFDLVATAHKIERGEKTDDVGLKLAGSEPVAFLNDSNRRLAVTYRAIRDGVEQVVDRLCDFEREYRTHGTHFYYEARRRIADETASEEVAALVIFLNKTCFNGLWRVNGDGGFNVPAGKFKNPPTICDEENLRACARSLASVAIWSEDFSCIDRECRPGDFVYFDPPYWPVSASSNFTAYTKESFGPKEQTRLRDLALDLKRRGVKVLLSNADVPPIRDLYAHGFNVERVEARRAINSKSDGRGSVGEVLIT